MIDPNHPAALIAPAVAFSCLIGIAYQLGRAHMNQQHEHRRARRRANQIEANRPRTTTNNGDPTP